MGEQYPRLEGDADSAMPVATQHDHTYLRKTLDLRQWDATDGKELPYTSSSGLPISGGFSAGKGSGLEDNSSSSRMTLPTIVTRLQTRLNRDWDDSVVLVTVTDQDLVQVAFQMGSVDSERGVLAYMHVLSKDVDLGLR